MKKVFLLVVALVSFSVGAAAQRCAETDVILKLRCPNCAERFTSYGMPSCTFSGNPCLYFQPTTVCCGEYENYRWSGSYCLLARLRDRGLRLRLVELARTGNILVPNCDGAYVPARMVLKALEAGDAGGT